MTPSEIHLFYMPLSMLATNNVALDLITLHQLTNMSDNNNCIVNEICVVNITNSDTDVKCQVHVHVHVCEILNWFEMQGIC